MAIAGTKAPAAPYRYLGTRRFQAIYRTAPSWEVGEDGETRDLAAPDRTERIGDNHYADDYGGKVVAVVPKHWTLGPKNLAAGNVSLVEVDVTWEQLRDLRQRGKKLVLDGDAVTFAAVTFADRHGALAAEFADKRARIEALETSEELPDPERAPTAVEKLARQERESLALWVKLKMEALPRNITHSGVGLYTVGSAHDYATPNAADAQLWTDQGGATFTASQYIRIFADDGSPTTYNENVVISAGLVANGHSGFQLIVEGDPNAIRTDIVIHAAAGKAFYCNGPDGVHVRHLKLTSVDDYAIQVNSGAADPRLSDIYVDTASHGVYIYAEGSLHDSYITTSGAAAYGAFINRGNVVRCQIINTSGASSSVGAFMRGYMPTVETCFISGWARGIYFPLHQSVVKCVHNSIQSCVEGIRFGYYGSANELVLLNNVFDGATYPLRIFRTAVWPEETTTKIGPKIIARENSFYNYTGVLWDGTTAKTFAQFETFNRVEASGNTDGVDPLVNADGTLQAGSPCINAGKGAGVITDAFGNTTACPEKPAAGCDFQHDVALDFPDVGNVTGDTVDGEAGTRTDADPAAVLDTEGSFGDPGSPLIPSFDLDASQLAFEAGRNDDIAVGNVKLAHEYQNLGEDKVGTYTGSLVQPDSPEWNGEPVEGDVDGTVELGVTADVGAVIYAFYRYDENAWSVESESFKVTGSGSILITGLERGHKWEFDILAKYNNIYSVSPGTKFLTLDAPSTAATDNISVAKRAMKQTAVYWPLSIIDGYGKPAYDTPVEIDCRWEQVQEEFIASDGTRQLSRAKLIVDRDVEVGGALFLGGLDDLEDSDDPKNNDGGWEIRSFNKTPDLKGKKFLREVYL